MEDAEGVGVAQCSKHRSWRLLLRQPSSPLLCTCAALLASSCAHAVHQAGLHEGRAPFPAYPAHPVHPAPAACMLAHSARTRLMSMVEVLVDRIQSGRQAFSKSAQRWCVHTALPAL